MAEHDRSLSVFTTSLEHPAPVTERGEPSAHLATVWTMLRDAGLEPAEERGPAGAEPFLDGGTVIGACSADAAPADAFAARLTAAFHSGALATRASPVAGPLGQAVRQTAAPVIETFTMQQPVRRPTPGRETPRARYTPVSIIGRPLYTPW